MDLLFRDLDCNVISRGFNFYSVIDLVNRVSKKEIDLRPEYQRNSVWKLYQKQDFIDTLLRGLPILPLAFNEIDSGYEIFDGQQRTVSIIEFINDKFKTKPFLFVKNINIGNKFFSELPDNIKKGFETYNIPVLLVKGNRREIELLFWKYQQGEHLSKAEQRHALSGKIKEQINILLKHNFFTYSCKFTDQDNKRFKVNELIEQIMVLEMYGIVDLDYRGIETLYIDYAFSGIPTESLQQIGKILDYLFYSFRDYYGKSYFKKTNVQSLYLMAKEMIKEDPDMIYAEQFGKWFITFEKERLKPVKKVPKIYSMYNAIIATRISDKEKIKKRISILLEEWYKYKERLLKYTS